MALGANVGSTASGQSQTVSNALVQARLTGRAVPIPNPDGSASTLVAYPTGTIGTPGGGFGGQGTSVPQMAPTQPVAQPVASSSPFTAAGVAGLPGSPSGPAVPPPQQVQAPLNQANPNTTYVSPNTPQPAAAAPVVGQTGTQSGDPGRADLVVTARRYRAAHGLSTSDDTDALNAESLAAAQAGRTYFNPALAAQYGQPQAAGAYGPSTNVVNALTTPPATAQTQQQAAQQAYNALQQQGIS